jgi:hypothetical protein
MNAINRHVHCSGNKIGAFSRELKIGEIKKAAKTKKCTINEFMTSILSMTFEEYFRKNINKGYKFNDGKVPKNIGVAIPFSVRERGPIEKAKFTNYFSIIPLNLPIT